MSARRAVLRIALIGHDNKKSELISWATANRVALARHQLCATGTTGAVVSKGAQLKIKRYKSGPLGGDMQIGSLIAQGKIDVLVFFWDPLSPHPHEPDVRALLRIATVYDIPIATNRATADAVVGLL
jgi:methylglyoxal synthase